MKSKQNLLLLLLPMSSIGSEVMRSWDCTEQVRTKEYHTCVGLWNISMNGYSFFCRVIQNPGYFGHSTYKAPENNNPVTEYIENK